MGVQSAATAAPDGYTLLIMPARNTMNPSVYLAQEMQKWAQVAKTAGIKPET
jgi:hypothetical protein